MNKKCLRRRNYTYEVIKVLLDNRHVDTKDIYFLHKKFDDKNHFDLDFLEKSKLEEFSSLR